LCRGVLGQPAHLRDPFAEFLAAAFRRDAVGDGLNGDGVGNTDGNIGYV
jgi:hypothetical protein